MPAEWPLGKNPEIVMRVLLAHNDYAKFSGEEDAVETVARVLEAQGHTVRWFRRSSAEIGDSLVNKTHAMFSGIYSFESRRQFAKVLENEKPDLVQVQNLFPLISPAILPVCAKRNIPVVMRCPNYRLFCPNGLHFSHGELCERCLGTGREWRCVLRNCEEDWFKSTGYAARNAFARITGMIQDNVTVFIVLSEFQKKRFADGGIPAEKLEILPNIAPTVRGPENDLPGDTISFIGRISAEKGIREFVETAHRLPGLRFAVAGGTEGLAGLEIAAPANVEFMGFLKGQALDEFYKRTRILVFPSVCFEGFPNVVAKAMAHGKAVVASRIGSVPGIVDDGVTGLLFEPGDTEQLAEKIEYLWNRPEHCAGLGRAGRKKARKEYSEESFYERLMEIYAKAVQLNALRSSEC